MEKGFWDDRLTEKQEQFCQFYVATNNGKASAERAGYSAKASGVTASKLLKEVKIQNRITELRSEAIDKMNKDKEELIDWLYEIANPVNGEQTGTRIKAIELLGKYHQIFTEKRIVESTNKTEVTVQDYSTMSEEELEKALNALSDSPDLKIV